MKRVLILGSTGSIGESTLKVLAAHRDRYAVIGLVAGRNADALAKQIDQWQPRFAALADPAAAATLKPRDGVELHAGEHAICALAADPAVDIVVAGIVGAAGLAPVHAALAAGKRVLLANKEALICAGALMIETARSNRAELLPVDSEHNALFQVWPHPHRLGEPAPGVRRLILTASGGPFRGYDRSQLKDVTAAQAIKHPRWAMGAKISVDSATLMNKGLELIEAQLLFGVAPQALEVVVHPQSIVHSLLDFVDGSVLAQLGHPDMQTPIAHALGWPERLATTVPMLDLVALGQLQFEAADERSFGCLALARAALAAGGSMPLALNSANEVAVAAFLAGRIGFLDIADVNDAVLQAWTAGPAQSIAEVHELDALARRAADHAATTRSHR